MNKLSAYQEIALEYGGNTVFLRPSLRAATRLERLHDGFPALLHKIEEFDTGTVKAIITYSADRQDAERLLNHAAKQPLLGFVQAAQSPLFDLVTALLPNAPDITDDQAAPTTGNSMPWAEVFNDLFGLATGWLGWTPQTAWQATPQEITDAFTAHIAKLKAIHGTADDEGEAKPHSKTEHQKIVEQGFDPEFDRAGLFALKDMGTFK